MNRLAPQTGTGFRLRAGDVLTVVDPTGGQVADLFALAADDPEEWLSSGRSIDYGTSLLLGVGDVLYSNRSRPMLTILEDTCGRHDFLLTPCSQETFDLLYPELGGAPHPSCFDNLSSGLAPFGVPPDRIGTTFNIFMNVWSEPDGTLHIDPPTSVAGDRIVLRAEQDLIVGLTACSAEKSNGGVCKPIDWRVADAAGAPRTGAALAVGSLDVGPLSPAPARP
ncbi:MAG: urea carboxylase-associated family protein [Candidatus Nanopelagicales bacterium]|nr:urea carboxylase-associated family protein [Candidatus Nanopelagicales bacterium]